MVDKIQLEAGLELWKVKVSDLREQDLNARVMPGLMFERLTETILRDKRLESLPFCAVTSKGLEIVSGHHRVRAARAGGMETIFVIVDITGLTKSQIKAKQLAHNAVAGIDDPSILAQIFDELDSVEDMRESFVDRDALDGLDVAKLNEVVIDAEMKTVLLTFLPTYFERWDKLIESQRALVDQIAVADIEQLDSFRQSVAKIGKTFDIRSASTVICKFIGMADGYGTEGEWVSIVDIFGPRVPKAAADVLKKSVAAAVDKQTISDKNKWQLLEYWAADYLAGVENE